MMFKYLVLGLLLFGVSAEVKAEVPPELQGFEFLEDALPKDEFGSTNRKKDSNSRRSMQKDIIPQIVEKIPELASYNIQNAEQVFCYHIEKREKNYKILSFLFIVFFANNSTKTSSFSKTIIFLTFLIIENL